MLRHLARLLSQKLQAHHKHQTKAILDVELGPSPMPPLGVVLQTARVVRFQKKRKGDNAPEFLCQS